MALKTQTETEVKITFEDIRKFVQGAGNGKLDVEATIDNFAQHLTAYKAHYDDLAAKIEPLVVDILTKAAANPDVKARTVDTPTLAFFVAQNLAGNDFAKVNEYKNDVLAFIKANSCQPDQFNPMSPKLICTRRGRGGGLSLFAKPEQPQQKLEVVTVDLGSNSTEREEVEVLSNDSDVEHM